MHPGYGGRILRVDLSKGRVWSENLDENVLKKYVGGVGYAAKMLFDKIPAGSDPLSPKNILLFATGPLTGTQAPGSGSVEVCFKSPLTGIWGESRSGGEWGGALKKAGFDFLAIEGKAEQPSYIVIEDGNAAIRSASGLSGKSTSEKEKILRQEKLNDDSFDIVTIGPGGEKRVRFACIMSGGCAFGRGGAGAVMGSKNVLAVAVKGTGKIPVARPEELRTLSKEMNRKALENMGKDGMSIGGTTDYLEPGDVIGDIPTKNWRSNSWGIGKEIYAHFRTKNLIKADTCYRGCVLRCKRILHVASGPWKTPVHKGGEYESMAALTFYVLNQDVDAAVHASYLCNEYGLDSISTGGVIAFAMECFENGILGEGDPGGLDLSWGNTESIVKLVEDIALRKGIGRLLGEGVKRASESLGRGSERYAIHVKGMEGPAHDPRCGKTLAITYGLGNRGMCHMHPIPGMGYDMGKNDMSLIPYGVPDPQTIDAMAEEGKGAIAKKLQDWGIVPDILGICKFYILFAKLTPEDIAEITSAVTGQEVNGKALLDLGSHVYDLQRRFNTREGITKADDRIPERCRSLPEFGSYSTAEECTIKNLDRMLEECYQARGWNKETGVPEPSDQV
ncbi:MAG: aldehyde ferredoxin oxidoreductase family protein [Candidatus Aminicenantes bacterium]|nr:aldehyde ferredoxin oxidoreductase family protein [Candidatus Aminicenantes bacterium]